MSWQPEVEVEGAWQPNLLRFATEQEAARYARELYTRWTLTVGWRATPSEDPVTHAYLDDELVRVGE